MFSSIVEATIFKTTNSPLNSLEICYAVYCGLPGKAYIKVQWLNVLQAFLEHILFFFIDYVQTFTINKMTRFVKPLPLQFKMDILQGRNLS